jgi:hypothetical protein
MIVINVDAVCDVIVEIFLFLLIAHSHKGDYRDCYSESRFRMENIILAPDGIDDLVKVATCVVRLVWYHLKHPRAIFEHQRKI